ncbi:MAG: hypothetical protein D084_Lepto4C00318G0005 [Leptospirillum sp. Group IV 'UBA BS']|nr:MAG: hypothetical protein D084_Lepto4C00318G0005 [Leptospirillum sp. Group IV 'UBA BS']
MSSSFRCRRGRFPGVFPPSLRSFRQQTASNGPFRDLFGYTPEGLEDLRPWIGHDLWAVPPLTLPPGSPVPENPEAGRSDYPFVRVTGPGVHEIPVGPVHAGIIEPGHFRFQVVGEKVLRLEELLGYTHKGVDSLFRNRGISWGARLAARISGDSTVAFSIAYAQGVEQALDFSPSAGVRSLRALLLERERIANHMGDLGAIGNDAGLAFALSQFGLLRENLLRKNRQHFGIRLLFDLVITGGVRTSLEDEAILDLLQENGRLTEEILELQKIFDDHGGLQDRFQNTGVLLPEVAHRLGLGGVVGRASAQAWDLRADHGGDPYRRFPPALALAHTGDVAARVRIRFLEIQESLSFSRALLEHLPEHSIAESLPDNPGPSEGLGIVEGSRGEVLAWVRLAPHGIIEAAHLQDPSALLWPALEMAVPGNLVADFPLINKSFNLSYSGNDL